MTAYVVSLPSGRTMGNKNTDVVVWAEDATMAVELAKAAYAPGNETAWDLATTTEIAAASDFLGWTIRVQVKFAAAQTGIIDVIATGVASDTLDLLAAEMVTVLNGLGDIAGAAYDNATQILTVAAIGDGLGDGTITVTVSPPGVNRGPVASYVTATKVDGGIAAAVLTQTLGADALTVGNIVAELPNRV